MKTRGKTAIRLAAITGTVALTTLLVFSPAVAEVCVGRVAGLATGANGFTVVITNTCEEQCSGGLDSALTHPGTKGMLTNLLSAQARGAIVTASYDIVGTRCVVTSTGTN